MVQKIERPPTRISLGKSSPRWYEQKELFDAKFCEGNSLPYGVVMFPEMPDGQQPIQSKTSQVPPSEFLTHLLDIHAKFCSMCRGNENAKMQVDFPTSVTTKSDETVSRSSSKRATPVNQEVHIPDRINPANPAEDIRVHDPCFSPVGLNQKVVTIDCSQLEDKPVGISSLLPTSKKELTSTPFKRRQPTLYLH
ncbi:uncharacterized protein [Amphiura filiformis]|uniref:uncharacterized protein n=1 Tax=Amphiura filiformis TaxID=82378 RepID=UPI003B210920